MLPICRIPARILSTLLICSGSIDITSKAFRTYIYICVCVWRSKGEEGVMKWYYNEGITEEQGGRRKRGEGREGREDGKEKGRRKEKEEREKG